MWSNSAGFFSNSHVHRKKKSSLVYRIRSLLLLFLLLLEILIDLELYVDIETYLSHMTTNVCFQGCHQGFWAPLKNFPLGPITKDHPVQTWICANKVEIHEIHAMEIWVSVFQYLIYNQILMILFIYLVWGEGGPPVLYGPLESSQYPSHGRHPCLLAMPHPQSWPIQDQIHPSADPSPV